MLQHQQQDQAAANRSSVALAPAPQGGLGGPRPLPPRPPLPPHLLTAAGKALAPLRKWVPLFLMSLWLFVLQQPALNRLNLFCLGAGAAIMLAGELTSWRR